MAEFILMINKVLFLTKRVDQYRHRLLGLYLIYKSDLFNKDWYLARNPDVAKAKINPILHYLYFGGFEERDPGPNFSNTRYLNAYKEVKQAGINPLFHFLRYGKKEGHRIYPSYIAELLASRSLNLFQNYSENIRCDPIIVHQMGKVGSQTVVLSLKKAFDALGITIPVYHTHILNDFDRAGQTTIQLQNQRNIENESTSFENGKSVRKQIDQKTAQHWNIVSLIRDPIARNVAAFFQNLPDYIPDWRERYANNMLTIHDMQALFLEVAQGDWGLDDWFVSQMKAIPAFGIDVYATAFPHNIGYKIYPGTSQASLLLLRLENLTTCVQNAMYEFLGLQNFILHNINIAETKDYAMAYRAFKAAPLPLEYVERIYNSQLARHFYNEAELEVFTKRWTIRG